MPLIDRSGIPESTPQSKTLMRIGTWRTHEGGMLIDASGSVVDGTKMIGRRVCDTRCLGIHVSLFRTVY